jgi:hypothetical protein
MLQAIDGGEGIDPKLQATGLHEILARTKRGADQATGVMRTGTSGSEIGVTGARERGTELLGRGQRRHLEWGLRGLIGHAEVLALPSRPEVRPRQTYPNRCVRL